MTAWVDGTLGGREIGVDEVERLSLHLGLGLQKVGNPFRTAKCAYKEPPTMWLFGF
jgi:hypothetical protein